MARNIARAGIRCRAWNRTPDKAAPLAADGAYIAATPADAAAGAGIVLTMLSDADAVVTAMESPGWRAAGHGGERAAGSQWPTATSGPRSA